MGRTPLACASTADMRALLIREEEARPSLKALGMRFVFQRGLPANELPEDLRFDLEHYFYPTCASAGAKGADADGDVEFSMGRMTTRLHVAVLAGHPQCVRALIANGATRINERDQKSKNTPLVEAAKSGDGATIRALLEGATKMQIPLDKNNLQEALWYAISQRSFDGVFALLQAGANPAFLDPDKFVSYVELAQRVDRRLYNLLRLFDPQRPVAYRVVRVVTLSHLWMKSRHETSDMPNWRLRFTLLAIDFVQILTQVPALIFLELSALYGLLTPYNGRKLYATIERAQYGNFFLAPCFQPEPSEHLFGGDLGTRDAW